MSIQGFRLIQEPGKNIIPVVPVMCALTSRGNAIATGYGFHSFSYSKTPNFYVVGARDLGQAKETLRAHQYTAIRSSLWVNDFRTSYILVHEDWPDHCTCNPNDCLLTEQGLYSRSVNLEVLAPDFTNWKPIVSDTSTIPLYLCMAMRAGYKVPRKLIVDVLKAQHRITMINKTDNVLEIDPIIEDSALAEQLLKYVI